MPSHGHIFSLLSSVTAPLSFLVFHHLDDFGAFWSGFCLLGFGVFFFFFCHTHGMWKFPDEGLNLSHSSDPSCFSDNVGS